jgi:aminoglycoside phosphotransferase (APT) family kinase protein
MPEWTADESVDEELVRRIVAEQFPQVEARRIRLLAEGWDNAVWVVDETWAFRFPRRQVAVPLLELELAVLPRLAALLPLAIPAPGLHGKPSSAYPWPFVASPLLPGQELGSTVLTEAEEIAAADALGRFLRTLHSAEVTAEISALRPLPVDPNSRADMAVRVPRTRELLAAVEALGLWRRPRSVEGILAAAQDLPGAAPSALVHGDLHFRHLLVANGRLTGVIDWGDLCLADPSVDLQLLWSYFSLPAWAAFLEAYGPVPEDRLLRARVFALSISALLARYGHEEGRPEIERAALAGLERAAAE